LAEKSRYQETPARFEYRLTAKGAELLPVLQEICRWANHHLPDTWKTPKSFIELKSREIISKAGSMAAKPAKA
jgi:DNA-binding HxlR family transcriptional regulator